MEEGVRKEVAIEPVNANSDGIKPLLANDGEGSGTGPSSAPALRITQPQIQRLVDDRGLPLGGSPQQQPLPRGRDPSEEVEEGEVRAEEQNTKVEMDKASAAYSQGPSEQHVGVHMSNADAARNGSNQQSSVDSSNHHLAKDRTNAPVKIAHDETPVQQQEVPPTVLAPGMPTTMQTLLSAEQKQRTENPPIRIGGDQASEGGSVRTDQSDKKKLSVDGKSEVSLNSAGKIKLGAATQKIGGDESKSSFSSSVAQDEDKAKRPRTTSSHEEPTALQQLLRQQQRSPAGIQLASDSLVQQAPPVQSVPPKQPVDALKSLAHFSDRASPAPLKLGSLPAALAPTAGTIPSVTTNRSAVPQLPFAVGPVVQQPPASSGLPPPSLPAQQQPSHQQPSASVHPLMGSSPAGGYEATAGGSLSQMGVGGQSNPLGEYAAMLVQQHQQAMQQQAMQQQQQAMQQQQGMHMGGAVLDASSTMAATNAMAALMQQQQHMAALQQQQQQQNTGQQGVAAGTGGAAGSAMETHAQMLVFLASTNPQLVIPYIQQTGINPTLAQAILAQAAMQQASSMAATAQQQQATGATSMSTKRRASSPEQDGRQQQSAEAHMAKAMSGAFAGAGAQQQQSSAAHAQQQQQQSRRSPLMEAVQRMDHMQLRALLMNPAYHPQVNALLEDDTTLLIAAASLPEPNIASECVRLLLTFGAQGRVRDRAGFTAAHWAASLDNLEALRDILRADRQLVAAPCSKEGDTPLHRASRAGKHRSVRVLVSEFGANPLVLNAQHETAVEVAGKFFNTQKQEFEINETNRNAVRQVFFEITPYCRTLVLCHKECLDHKTGDTHQESAERITALFQALNQSEGACGLVVHEDFARASIEAVARVHDADYVQFLVDLDQQLRREFIAHPVPLTPRVQHSVQRAAIGELKAEAQSDTMFCADTLNAALRAAGAVTRGIDVVMNSFARNAFCAVRPPGHHAGTRGLVDSAPSCGFCVVNSIMVGAMHALSAFPTVIKRVAIVDFDVHHGNGTEDIIKHKVAPFSKDAVLLFSIHLYDPMGENTPAAVTSASAMGADHSGSTSSGLGASASTDVEAKYEFYPGTGGGDAWEDNIFNVPLAPLWKPQGSRTRPSGRLSYRKAVDERLLPLLRAYRPDLILVSAGFDAALNDVGCCRYVSNSRRVSGLDLIPDDFDYITKQLMRVANVCCEGRIVSVLEGGYGCVKRTESGAEVLDRDVFAKCVAAHVLALSGMSNH